LPNIKETSQLNGEGKMVLKVREERMLTDEEQKESEAQMDLQREREEILLLVLESLLMEDEAIKVRVEELGTMV